MSYKQYFTANTIIFIIILCILFTDVIPVFHGNNNERLMRGYSVKPDPDSVYRNSLSDSLPARILKAKLDSLNFFADLYMNPLQFQESNMTGDIGATRSEECDTCEIEKTKYPPTYSSERPDIKYYLRLENYSLVDDSLNSIHDPVYFKKKGKFYKKYLVIDSSEINNHEGLHVKWVNAERNYVASKNNPSSPHPELYNISIPVSNMTYQILKTLSVLVALIWIILFLQFIVKHFILFIYDLSKGKAFTEINYIRLFQSAYFLMLLPVGAILIKIIPYLLYRNYLKEDFIPYFNWSESRQLILAGLLVLLMARAFKKGYQIKEEQDLTV